MVDGCCGKSEEKKKELTEVMWCKVYGAGVAAAAVAQVKKKKRRRVRKT